MVNKKKDTTPMSESLTEDELLQFEEWALNPNAEKFNGTVEINRPKFLEMVAMARRCLSAEERLEKAVEALRLLHDFQNGCPLPSYEKHWNEAMEKVEKILEECEGTPKELRPHQECAPSVGTDAPPVERPTFDTELSALINRYSMERFSGTPDFILAEYLQEQLHLFSKYAVKRMEWHGNSDFGVMGYDSKTGTTSVPA
jgi:arginyl-tRNA--protein-N-Asp/Glu arginylyltransferase